VRDVEEDKNVRLVNNPYDGHNNGYESNVYESRASGLYGDGGSGQRVYGPVEGYLTSDELVEERKREKLMGVER
jgi:hypothetical protein